MHTRIAAITLAAASCVSAYSSGGPMPMETLSQLSVSSAQNPVQGPADPPLNPAQPAPQIQPADPGNADEPERDEREGAAGHDQEAELKPGHIRRVGGEPPHEVVREADNFSAGPCLINTPLPDGYPDPTPPGAIDIKRYPLVRRAEVSGSGRSDIGMSMAFFPLFQHIKSRDIAMTSPVEMDYPAPGDTEPAARNWTMSFLYRSPDLGPTGEAQRNIRVVDVPPMTVLAIGLRGTYSESRIRDALEPLYDWLAANPEWKIAGPPRALYYNGPERRNPDKWAEAQIPIVRR